MGEESCKLYMCHYSEYMRNSGYSKALNDRKSADRSKQTFQRGWHKDDQWVSLKILSLTSSGKSKSKPQWWSVTSPRNNGLYNTSDDVEKTRTCMYCWCQYRLVTYHRKQFKLA